MESKEFEWTPDLFKEFANYAIPESNALNFSFEKCVEQFKASKERKPLFKDFLGNDVFEGDKFYVVDINLNIQAFRGEGFIASPETPTPAFGDKYFSLRDSALHYISENEKRYSVKDVREALKSKDLNELKYGLEESIISELQKKK